MPSMTFFKDAVGRFPDQYIKKLAPCKMLQLTSTSQRTQENLFRPFTDNTTLSFLR